MGLIRLCPLRLACFHLKKGYVDGDGYIAIDLGFLALDAGLNSIANRLRFRNKFGMTKGFRRSYLGQAINFSILKTPNNT
jgi:hypothetical protein